MADIEKTTPGQEKRDDASSEDRGRETPELDLLTLHEVHAGRLVIDPEEAKIEFGERVAARLKLSADGTKVLYPQPTDSPRDPQNWSDRKKNFLLFIITLAAIVPDFDSGIGDWSIFLLGWGGKCCKVNLNAQAKWMQFIAMAFLVGCAVAPTLKTFTAMRCLTAFFATAPQVTGLYVVCDLFPFHLQARKLNVWTMGFLISPFLSPFAFGFLVARTTWRWAYGIGCMYSGVVVAMIVLFMEETMYDRHVKPIPEPTSTGLRLRIETLLGITGIKMAKYRTSWRDAIISPFNVVWRPHLLLMLIYEGVMFGFSIGINVTNAVFLGMPRPEGYGFGPFGIAGGYGTPIVAVLLGEIIGRYVNDAIADWGIRRNHGVFEAEVRLWMCYLALPIFICGMVVLGATFQNHLSVVALVFGWGLAEISVMMTTVAVYAYCNDSFPKHQGEISALINLARTLGGFAIAYYQVPWAEKHGALQTFGCEAAIVAGLFLLIIPFMQIKGGALRNRFSL
ncbi:MFS general substrate transporter [Auricularia subglabra TFB-10046 SS5]|nr:MFS general substrate transporter [Auricularia subglabra TFB-10046 SS5]